MIRNQKMPLTKSNNVFGADFLGIAIHVNEKIESFRQEKAKQLFL